MTGGHQDEKAPSVVDSAKQVLEGEEHQEDKDELTSQDFSKAATNFQESVAGAVQYVSDALKPSSGGDQGAENDPEVKEFRQAAAEAADGVKQTVEPKEGSQAAQNQKGVSDQASDAVNAVKEKVLPTAHAAGPDEDKSSLQQAKDSISGGAQAVAGRFTAPASGDSALDKEAKHPQGGSSEVHSAVQDAKDSIAGAGSYIANRFTASPAGDGKSAGQAADETKKESQSGGLLSGILPRSNEGEKGSPGGKSLADKAQDKYDSVKAEANITQDSIADQITPKTQEEADISAGYIPSNTADLKK